MNLLKNINADTLKLDKVLFCSLKANTFPGNGLSYVSSFE
ncbi:MAG: hypothetical protein RHS_1788 [Robinsoniella sp. RHS]|nr:MAG: hypothetical protein RHS_1788 [Robinsoniella sp. RHS]